MTDDPTLPIVGRSWSEWVLIGDLKGHTVKGRRDLGDLPRDNRPAVYEIAALRGDPERGGEFEVLYVGQTSGRSQGVRTRLSDHFMDRDSLWIKVKEATEKGDWLYARYIQFDDPRTVKRLELELRNKLRPRGRYPWNEV